MSTANEDYRDAALRHQIGLRRYTSGVAKKVSTLLAKADAELVAMLRRRLGEFSDGPIDFTGARWQSLLNDVRAARAIAMKDYKKLTGDELEGLAPAEAEREISLLRSAIPIEVSFTAVSSELLNALITSRPFHGRLLGEWFETVDKADQGKLIQALQLGMAQGESVDSIVRRIIGTKANDFADGILSETRRNATAITRTAINHVSNAARNAVWEGNDDIITCKIWSATLDGRTSDICIARDGCGSPTAGKPLPESVKPLDPPDARPPAHINCRSTMIAWIDGIGLIGNRPTVTDTRNRRSREIDFRAEARSSGRSVQDIRREWSDKNIGRVPSQTTYQEFLARQSAAFQDDVLGKTKGRLFRSGGLTVQNFVDRNGQTLTLSELRATRPEAFVQAGLD